MKDDILFELMVAAMLFFFFAFAIYGLFFSGYATGVECLRHNQGFWGGVYCGMIK